MSPRTELVLVSTRDACARCALALDAAGIGYNVRPTPEGYAILVAPDDAQPARNEIEAYMEEHRAPIAATGAPPSHGGGWAGVAGYVVVLGLITAFEHQGAFAQNWFAMGKMHAGLVRQGEIWRTVTALTLHGDLVHLLGNLVIGGLVGLFAGQLLGSGAAWMCILLAGASGNLLNACMRQSEHTSIGASTAVFATLGLLAGHAWLSRRRTRSSRLVRYAPLVGGVVLLGYLGAGGERTDVLAHVTGFVAGTLLGILLAWLGKHVVIGRTGQVLLGLGAMALIVLAWAVALSRPAAS